jgi:dihydroorotase
VNAPAPGTAGGPPIAYVGARLIDPERGIDLSGGVVVADGRIADSGAHLARAGAVAAAGAHGMEVFDCRGACLAPGLIDIRVQAREPGEEHKETLASASEAAAAGGITTMVCLPNTQPAIDDAALVESVARRARETARIRVLTYGAATRGLAGRELTEMGLLAEAGAVGFTDATHAIADAGVMRRALAYAGMLGKVVVQHPEEPALARSGVMNEGEIATRLGLPGITPAAEAIMVERDLRLAAITRGRLHVAHVSTRAALETIRAAKAAGLAVTADTAPHYFALNELAVGDYRTFAKLSPPLRSEDDRQAVVAALADGTLDAIASDHAPHDQDSKRLPFAQAAYGTLGLETLLPVTLELVASHRLSLVAAIRLLTTRPAQILGLAGGRLAKGEPADLVLFDPERAWKVDPARLRSKAKNSVFDGRPVQGRVLRTLVAGATVFALPAAPL